jgi:hypothetical protein
MKLQEWQTGSECKLTSLERLRLHNIWLNDMKEELKKSISNKESITILTEEDIEKEKM